MKKSIITGICLAFGSFGFTQEVKKVKPVLNSITQIGILAGSQRDALLIQTINGVSIKNWETDIGIGIDNYNERSIPLFVDIRRTFGKRTNAPFAYADAGINFGWLNFIQREQQSFPDYKQPSWYYDAGMGWKIALKNKAAILLSAGYTLKQLKGERIIFGGPVIGGQPTERKETFENTYRRIVFKAGIKL